MTFRTAASPAATTAPNEAEPIEPLAVGVERGKRMLGIGRTMLYELMASGDIESVKIGRRRLIIVESAKRCLRRHQSGLNKKIG